jgi:hypothetical protein
MRLLTSHTGISSATPLIPSPPTSAEDVTLAIYVARAHLALSPPETDKAIALLSGWGDDKDEAKGEQIPRPRSKSSSVMGR